ncbi:MAG: magnesium chelatase subunit H [Pseudomonadota bacterium]
MPKRSSAAKAAAPIKAVIVTLDTHLASAVERAAHTLLRDLGVALSYHAAAQWGACERQLTECREAIAEADLIFVSMLFVDDHIREIRPALEARRSQCDAIVCVLSAPEVCQLTRIGSLDMSKPQGKGLSWLKRLRGSSASDGSNGAQRTGERQMAMLKRLPHLLRFVPGTAQDLRVYFLSMRYWLYGSQRNLHSLVSLLAARYAKHAAIEQRAVPEPIEYPDVGVYHPDLSNRISDQRDDLMRDSGSKPRVGLIVMRSYVLAENTAHYDAMIRALEARGLCVVPVFSSGLDARPAIDRYFRNESGATIDLLISLTGFSLVGGPAYNDSEAATKTLIDLDVPYFSAHALEFQSLPQWRENGRGLLPLETMMMVAIPELDGAIGTSVYGGREQGAVSDLGPELERVDRLADRCAKMIRLRHTPREERRIAVVLYDFPPNSGGIGSAAHLSVFESLHKVLTRLADEGYSVPVPASVDDLRAAVLEDVGCTSGLPARVADRVSVEDHVRRETWLDEIEAVWGAAPGRSLTDGRSLFVLGARIGNVLIAVQPPFGVEGDPMRLMFAGGHAPTHAFSAFYRYLREDFAAHAVLHFGTHGALEFMPGKQVGLSDNCWPERLVGSLPNLYLYAANNPSEGAIAKRRSAATTITYLTPSITRAGLYQEFKDLDSLINQLRDAEPTSDQATAELFTMVRERAASLEIMEDSASNWQCPAKAVDKLRLALRELQETYIPDGLHVLGSAPSFDRLTELLQVMDLSLHADADPFASERYRSLARGDRPNGEDAATRSRIERLCALRSALCDNQEIESLVAALDGGFVPPVAGGDLIRNPAVLPTGRNLHGFDPSRLPSLAATMEGQRQANALLTRAMMSGEPPPKRIAMVLWGTDTLKNEGVGVAEALWLMGTRAKFDGYGRLTGAELISLDVLGRPRVDVVVSVSGIFRDLLPGQLRLLAEAALLVASADEPASMNPLRAQVLKTMESTGVSLETAALRVFGNSESAYGANVNQLIDAGIWDAESELGDMFVSRRSFAYGPDGQPAPQADLLRSVLSTVDLTFQNLDSVELGVTTLDHYVDSLGGISRAVENARGKSVPTLVGDYTQGEGTVRSLADQIALETRTRMLNPRWYEGLLEHGYEGVHQIEAHVTNTMGWSATTQQVAPWVYRELSRTFVLDPKMRERLAALNPKASLKLANRLLEAHERNYWSPDEATLAALQQAGDDLEDRIENVAEGALA